MARIRQSYGKSFALNLLCYSLMSVDFDKSANLAILFFAQCLYYLFFRGWITDIAFVFSLQCRPTVKGLKLVRGKRCTLLNRTKRWGGLDKEIF